MARWESSNLVGGQQRIAKSSGGSTLNLYDFESAFFDAVEDATVCKAVQITGQYQQEMLVIPALRMAAYRSPNG